MEVDDLTDAEKESYYEGRHGTCVICGGGLTRIEGWTTINEGTAHRECVSDMKSRRAKEDYYGR